MSSPSTARRSKLASRVLSDRLTARRAAWIIGAFTLALTILATFLVWLLDRDDFPNLGISAWWALQTLTTVGYGDFVPTTTEGRAIGAVVMIGGIGFLTVITASIAAAFVETAQRRARDERDPEAVPAMLTEKLDEVIARLERLEQAVDPSPQNRSEGREPEGGSSGDP